jgi:hypothetical protein
MNRVAWAVLAVVLVLLVALSVKKYALPALVSGREAPPARTPKPAAEPVWPMDIPGLNVPASQDAEPAKVKPPSFAPVPITAARARRDADRPKEALAVEKLRAQMELERRLAGDPTPRVDTIVAMAENRFSAMIGEALVSEGGTVQGYRVRKITANSVEFEKDGQVWVQKVD